MKLSMEWLNDYVNISHLTADELAERLSRTGLEIDGIENIGADLHHLVIGLVESCVPQPDSDHLQVTHVNVGGDQPLQIVCGAPNVQMGQKVIVAVEGAVLPGDFKIKKSKLRGQTSEGMLCSLQELGFSDNVIPKEYHDGIFVLDADAPVGMDVIEYLKLDDSILEIDLTPNRADALSMRGVAYEVAAVLDRPLSFEIQYDAPITEDVAKLTAIDLTVADSWMSDRYQLRLIEDVVIAESPDWLQIRLMKSGIRPINNIVDVTNYFLMLYGQPMHAFDYDTLSDQGVRVDAGVEGTSLTTLDGVERKLTSDDLVIYNGDTPIALAGVMGGLSTEVTDETTSVLLETAVFNSEAVRLTSKRFALRSESSARFEKGINPATIDEAGWQAAHLMAQLGQGALVDGLKEVQNKAIPQVEIEVHFAAIPNKIGIHLTTEQIQHIMDQLDFEVTFKEESFIVEIPPRRWDLRIEADILEEIARIYGYDNIPTTLPIGETTVGVLTQNQLLDRKTRDICEGIGLNQVISYVLTSQEHANMMASPTHPFVTLTLPISEERTVLRQSMFPALMETAQFNRARQNQDLAFYEIGNVFFGQGAGRQPLEEERLGILLSGRKDQTTWYQEASQYDFYDLKGMLETYFDSIGSDSPVTFESNADHDSLHPGRTADIYLGQDYVGVMGQVHPTVARAYDLDDQTFFAELTMSVVMSHLKEESLQRAIPKYPASTRDLALLVKDTQAHAMLADIIHQNGGDNLQRVELFDMYSGQGIQEGMKSLAYHLVFQNPNRTLTDQEIDAIMTSITEALQIIPDLQIR